MHIHAQRGRTCSYLQDTKRIKICWVEKDIKLPCIYIYTCASTNKYPCVHTHRHTQIAAKWHFPKRKSIRAQIRSRERTHKHTCTEFKIYILRIGTWAWPSWELQTTGDYVRAGIHIHLREHTCTHTFAKATHMCKHTYNGVKFNTRTYINARTYIRLHINVTVLFILKHIAPFGAPSNQCLFTYT